MARNDISVFSRQVRILNLAHETAHAGLEDYVNINSALLCKGDVNMRAIFALVLMLCSSPLAFGQVNFNGNWIYDASASTLYSGGLTIVHSGNNLTIIWTIQNGTSEFTCVLDGSEHAVVVANTRTIKYRSVLDGNVLHITWTVISNGKTEPPLDDTYVLSDGGKTLTRLVPVTGSRGPAVRKVVFRKG
jgi:hypothetical protein